VVVVERRTVERYVNGYKVVNKVPTNDTTQIQPNKAQLAFPRRSCLSLVRFPTSTLSMPCSQSSCSNYMSSRRHLTLLALPFRRSSMTSHEFRLPSAANNNPFHRLWDVI
jgi:hypothetical protein